MNRPLGEVCKDIHFKKIIMPHTDDTLGNCSYLDTCRHMDYCKYIHYKIDEQDENATCATSTSRFSASAA